MHHTDGHPGASAAWKFARGNALSVTLLSAFVSGCLVVVLHGDGFHKVSGLLWSAGFAAAGILLGFLFAVPRPSRVTPVAVAAHTSPRSEGSDGTENLTRSSEARADNTLVTSAAMEINTNLMEISDWLTKIIVGVGLVELKRLPGYAESVARFIAPSLNHPAGVPLAGAIMLYFSVLGFLSGYLLTRIYITQWFRWADEQARGQMQLDSGKFVDLDDLTRLQQPVIEDLQAQVAALVARTPRSEAPAGVAPAVAARRLRILWTDDRPDTTTLQVNMLEKDGHRVDTALDTDHALFQLNAHHYDLLVTDMRRTERGQDRPTAGLDLLREAKASHPDLPVVIFCGRKRAEQYADEARRAGAALITASGTALLAQVRERAQQSAAAS